MFYFAESTGFVFESIPGSVPVSQQRHVQLMDGQAAGQRIVAGPDGAPMLVNATTTPPTLEDARSERDRRIAAGCEVTVSGLSEPISITGRPADRDNLSGLGLVALARLGAADTTAIRFRDAADMTHTVTPAQMMEIVTGGAEFIEACHEVVWSWADAGSVPADYADDSHWP